MSKLRVLLNSVAEREVNLEVGREYILGRGSQCEIVLDADKRISRQHIKIKHNGTNWVVEVMSRFGEVYLDGQKSPTGFEMPSDMKFSIPPYEFEFLAEDSQQEAQSEEISVEDEGVVEDKTFVGQLAREVAFLRIFNELGELMKVFQLEGVSWVAGRDTSNAIFIDYSQMSRRHFEIQFRDQAFHVKDLGSANGTLVNGVQISPEQLVALQSGDIIQVGNWTINFELRDTSFEEKIGQLSHDMRAPAVYSNEAPVAYNEQDQFPAQYMPPETPMAYDYRPPPMPVVNQSRKKIFRIGIGLGLTVIALLMIFPDKQKNIRPNSTGTNSRPADPFQKLSKEKQELVKDTYNLAERFYKDGKYELARVEISKVHQLVPYYLESQSLEKYCQIAIDTQLQKQAEEDRTKKMAAIIEQVQKQVDICRKKLNPNIEVREMDDCLASVISLDPGSAAITQLKQEVDALIAKRMQDASSRAEHQGKVKRLQSLYEKAQSTESGGNFLDAISEYRNVISSSLPDPNSLKLQARRKIASIEGGLSSKQQSLEREANEARRRGDLKKAHASFKLALEYNSTNESIRGQMTEIIREMEKQFRSTWEESVIEENVGDLEAAKIKWKKIMDQCVSESKYYSLARAKLKKYGVH